MMEQIRSRVFWGNASPAVCLSGSGLVIMASDRLAHAIAITGALLWVYGLATLAVHAGTRIFPQQGRPILLVCLTSFVASVYLLLLWIISPLCVLQMFFVISLVPVVCMLSGTLDRLADQGLEEKFFGSLREALILGALIVIFALIREPLGYLSLSLPGGAQGIVLLFSFENEALLPIRLIASSCGALLLSGYLLGLYRYYRAVKAPKEGA
ncbi:MAG: hypothetical protein LBQ69_00940 [Treponema sp.]|jgi:hypothetical protein|nr:hypothetical protein [Treponema sp.]